MTTGSRLVVTGAGVVTPFGADRQQTWERLVNGELAYRPMERFATTDLAHHLAGQIPDPVFDERLPTRQHRRLPRHDRMIMAAFRDCLRDSGLEASFLPYAKERVGIYFGTSRGPAQCTEDISCALIEAEPGSPAAVDPLRFRQTVVNAPLGHISIHYGITGPCVATANGSCAGMTALEMARMALRSGDVDLAFVGGGEELTEIYYRAMADLRVLTPTDAATGGEERMVPFDRARNGHVLSEGAAFVALERLDDHRRRGGKARAELLAVATAADGFSHYGNAPDGSGYRRAMTHALRLADLPFAAVDLVLSAGSGAEIRDRAEALALASLTAANPRRPAITALKGLTGEFGAASAVFGIVMAAAMFEHGRIPPLPTGRGLDPDFVLDLVTAPRSAPVDTVLLNESGWGGLYGAAILRAVREHG